MIWRPSSLRTAAGRPPALACGRGAALSASPPAAAMACLGPTRRRPVTKRPPPLLTSSQVPDLERRGIAASAGGVGEQQPQQRGTGERVGRGLLRLLPAVASPPPFPSRRSRALGVLPRHPRSPIPSHAGFQWLGRSFPIETPATSDRRCLSDKHAHARGGGLRRHWEKRGRGGGAGETSGGDAASTSLTRRRARAWAAVSTVSPGDAGRR